MNWDEQVALNIQHSKDPKVGDYWEDHLCPVLQVLDVTHGIVIFFDEKKDVDANHWTWDRTKPKALPIPEFTKKLRYNLESLGEKTWACVHPNRAL